jgi:hypothetical protein
LSFWLSGFCFIVCWSCLFSIHLSHHFQDEWDWKRCSLICRHYPLCTLQPVLPLWDIKPWSLSMLDSSSSHLPATPISKICILSHISICLNNREDWDGRVVWNIGTTSIREGQIIQWVQTENLWMRILLHS